MDTNAIHAVVSYAVKCLEGNWNYNLHYHSICTNDWALIYAVPRFLCRIKKKRWQRLSTITLRQIAASLPKCM